MSDLLSSRELFLLNAVKLTHELNVEFGREWILVEDAEHHHHGTSHVLRWYDKNLSLQGSIAFSFGNTGVSLALSPSRYDSVNRPTEYYYDSLGIAFECVENYLRASA